MEKTKNTVTMPPLQVPGRKVYKVSEITREIHTLLEKNFPLVWVEGEISNFKHQQPSGHMYFTLKDEAAQLNCCFFARANQSLNFKLEDGIKIVAIGRVSVYDARGSYQLYVERVEPKGVGALQLAFEQLKKKLEAEGLFDPAAKKPIPKFPHRIGIVTSETGAALQDMLKVLKRKSYGFQIILTPARVQGEGAAAEIARAIENFNAQKDTDVLIVGRGGGSLEDLWAFNEEIVARAIFKSKIPVISAVGHEVDWTIADFVADQRAHTPTAAAEQVVFFWDELYERIREYKNRMQIAVKSIVKTNRENLESLLTSYAFRQPMAQLGQLSQRVDELLRQMQNYLRAQAENKKLEFQNVLGKLNALSPMSVLERGYSLTTDEKGSLVKTAGQIQVGSTMTTRFSKGSLKSKVIERGE